MPAEAKIKQLAMADISAFFPDQPTHSPLPRPQPRAPPSSVAEAKQQMAQIEGRRFDQKGGHFRRSIGKLDVEGNEFGSYDARVIAAIQQCWYHELERRVYLKERVGKVKLHFRMHPNGDVSNMEVLEAKGSVGAVLTVVCQKAVEEPAPYPPWPSGMRRLIPKNYRDVSITFYY